MEKIKNMDFNLVYKTKNFIIITFSITWSLIFFQEYQTLIDPHTISGFAMFTIIDFLISSSPLLAALMLSYKYLILKGKLSKYLFGDKSKVISYILVLILFTLQFLIYYFFRSLRSNFSVTKFLNVLITQIFLGGGLEEGGWRGYLQPALEKKYNISVAVVIVGLIWAIWHLPCFFIPSNLQNVNFLIYTLTCIALSFVLTAIYKLTKSILICTLFHAWTNSLAITFGADLSNYCFLSLILIETIISIIICLLSPYFEKFEYIN